MVKPAAPDQRRARVFGPSPWALGPAATTARGNDSAGVIDVRYPARDLLPCYPGWRAARLAHGDIEEVAMTGTTNGIVAGYDGSPGAAQALRWAAREAFARGTTLTVCLAWTPDHMELPTGSDLCDLARQHGQELLTRGLPYAE